MVRCYRVGNVVAKCSHDVFRVENAILARRGLVLNDSFNICDDFNPVFRFWSKLWSQYWQPMDYVPDELLQIPGKDIIDLPPGQYVYGMSFFDKQIFGHLWDTIQPLKNVQPGYTLLYNKDTDVVDLEKHWDVFGYNKSKRRALDVVHFNYRVPELYVPNLVVAPNMLKQEYSDWMFDCYQEWAKPYVDDVPRKLYLSRRGCSTRHVVNERDVEVTLMKHGFTIVSELYSLEQAVNLFHSATMIVGYHGSLFKNMFFCGGDPHVVEFCAGSRFGDPCFPRIARDRGFTRYNRYELDCVNDNEVRSDVELDIEWLEWLLAGNWEPTTPADFWAGICNPGDEGVELEDVRYNLTTP